jgi:hypothetical protein
MEYYRRDRWDRHPVADSEVQETFDQPSAVLLWLLPAALIWSLFAALAAYALL